MSGPFIAAVSAAYIEIKLREGAERVQFRVRTAAEQEAIVDELEPWALARVEFVLPEAER